MNCEARSEIDRKPLPKAAKKHPPKAAKKHPPKAAHIAVRR
jgi:hypothetical protein